MNVVIYEPITKQFCEVSERELFALQLAGTHKIAHRDPSIAYVYAREEIKKPWPLGEPAIATVPTLSYMYALYVLKDRFILGESSIAESSDIIREFYEEKFNIKLT